jgi:hypothetical protein
VSDAPTPNSLTIRATTPSSRPPTRCPEEVDVGGEQRPLRHLDHRSRQASSPAAASAASPGWAWSPQGRSGRLTEGVAVRQRPPSRRFRARPRARVASPAIHATRQGDNRRAERSEATRTPRPSRKSLGFSIRNLLRLNHRPMDTIRPRLHLVLPPVDQYRRTIEHLVYRDS